MSLPDRAAAVLGHVQASKEGHVSVSRALAAASTLEQQISAQDYSRKLGALRKDIEKMIDSKNCHPIMLRLAWHDAGTYDKEGGPFPSCGGANGSIRFDTELKHGANAGLSKAVRFLKPLVAKHTPVTWADAIQLAGAVAVELAGGPAIPMRYGRLDSPAPAREGNLPDATPSNPGQHVRDVFHRMGFSEREIVALIGAHTIGRAFKERSGAVLEGYGDDAASPYTRSDVVVRHDGKPGMGMAGGKAWSPKWLTFDNSYFVDALENEDKGKDRPGLVWFPTDRVLHEDSQFRQHFVDFAKSQDAFFEAYAHAHKKLSELGSSFAFEIRA
eukprot:TRINITY_DN10551_c0_g1_i1.p1 TRINITY_DN10551_c0_g1~~TRINITY_DN10551_c0_g1_i1.p1  ORF type:complete len:329 (+),score=63.64 TRINITY_DN10551_c0_g1_i1:761-1747(+)